MEEMLQAPTDGYGDAIVVSDILAENFKIRTGLLSLIQANQFHGFESNNPHDHIKSFNRITSTIKFRYVSNDAIKLMLFPYLLEGAAKIWYQKEPPQSVLTWGGSREAWERFKEMLRQCLHHGFSELHQINTFYNGLNEHKQDSLNVAAGGNLLRKTPQDALIINENKSKVHYSRNRPVAFKVSTTSSGNSSSTDARIDELTDTISNLVETFNKNMTTLATVKVAEETCVICVGAHPYYDCIAIDSNISSVCATTDLKAITTRSGVTLAGPLVSPPPSKEVDREPETITNQVLTESTNNVPPLVVHPSPISISFSTISYSKMPEVTKDTNYSAVILKKFPEKLGDPDEFLMPCDFPELDEFLAQADLSASINLMPLYIWRKLSLPELTSTQMILKLADRLTSRPAGIAEDVFVKVGKFHFPTDFVVVVYVVDPRVLLILDRPFLRTGRALIDVYGEELTLRVDDEAITFKVGQTSKYSYDNAESINQIDVIDIACEEYVQKVLGFSNNSKTGSPTPASDPIISSSSTSFTPFEGSDFILEEIETFLQTSEELSNLDDDYYDTEEDILYLEKLLNEDPSPNLPSVKENQEKDKIGSKPDKNGKRGEAGKSLKQLQWVEEEKLSKTQKEWPKCKYNEKLFNFKRKKKIKGLEMQLQESATTRTNPAHCLKLRLLNIKANLGICKRASAKLSTKCRKLSLPELTYTQMILELADRSTTRPAGIAQDVFVKVVKFHFLTDFVVVDYIVDPRVPLILERPFLRTGQALIDVYGEELTLRINDEAITFNVGQTSKYFYKDVESINRIDVIDDPPPNLPPMKTGDLKQVDATMTKPSINEPSELELKELPSHLEYAFLEGTDKLPVIIYKEIKDEEKSTLLKVLKSHKWVIAWKISDIKGIDPRFCTHKILIEDDFKPSVKHQRRVNSKIHEVIKKEVIKLLDAGLIYPNSDSPWVSPIHCVPKKDGITVVENEDNEFIPTRSWLTHKTKKRLPSLDLMERLPTYKTMDVSMDDLLEKCHFMVKEGIVLGHKISKSGIEVDRAKVDVKAKLPHPTSVKENLAADHLSRLENPHQDELENKEITEKFPLETLDMIAFCNTPIFTI
nr:DNA-directed DNA polymerase [Tanacetum cinerariifolium]